MTDTSRSDTRLMPNAFEREGDQPDVQRRLAVVVVQLSEKRRGDELAGLSHLPGADRVHRFVPFADDLASQAERQVECGETEHGRRQNGVVPVAERHDWGRRDRQASRGRMLRSARCAVNTRKGRTTYNVRYSRVEQLKPRSVLSDDEARMGDLASCSSTIIRSCCRDSSSSSSDTMISKW